MRRLTFTVYGEARPAGSKRAFTHPKTGRAIITDDTGKSGRTWRREIQAAAEEVIAASDRDVFPLVGPLVVTMVFYRRRPRKHYGARGGLTPAARDAQPATKPDLLKTARALEDALTGVAWQDDAQIVAELLSKRYGEPERVDVTVEAAE